MRPTAMIQDVLMRADFDLPEGAVTFPSDGWESAFEAAEAEGGPAPFVLCSLNVARRASRMFPKTAAGVILDEAPLRVSAFSGLLPENLLLNRSGVLIPLGALSGRASQMRSLYGDRVFLRPDSPMKEFSGFCCAVDDLEFEVNSAMRENAIHGDVLTFVDAARDIRRTEIRFWACDGDIVTFAPYAHDGKPFINGEMIDDAMIAARRAAQIYEPVANPVVIDVAIENGEPRVVELNAFSTSGVYEGADIGAIIAAGASIIA